ncbi:MAG: hypothetical protein K6F00_10345 [Lachnospiraceae bacterium]|nr:hypothetical protein [Lachnospiraceae bacterium]
MYSIFKGQTVKEEKRVIDSNDRVFARIEEYEEKLREKKQQRREDLLMEFLDSLEPDEEGNYYLPRNEYGEFDVPVDDDGEPLVNYNESGMLIAEGEEEEAAEEEAEDIEGEEEEIAEEEPEEDPRIAAREEAEFMVANARLEAEEIISEAHGQADALKQNAREEGRQEGFLQGQAQATAELEEHKSALNEEAAQLKADYDNRLASMERDVVGLISDIMKEVFLIEYSDHRDITLHLIENAVMGAQGSRDFLIRVNEANCDFLLEHKDEIQEKVGEGANIEFIRDPLMEDTKCLIETDGGVFDCGMDTQINNLIKEIKALSVI